ncbi:ABC transporter permease [Fulvivirga sp. 29W222]|uniref:ABC transporter permease n=1 Tax=Fulvivirga marina TaxID=2494733 RepID=A0A937FVV9_9BACT|nr:ABC transporter permease [Fulvivirga marina]MBL6447085.1 ABC transporter permease [Fulvivirga marina]
MDQISNPTPPRWPSLFLRWYCHPDYLEDIEGDLIERFETTTRVKGVKAAKWNYTKDVARLFRPGIIRPLSGSYQLNQYGMFKNYFKVGIRNILRHKAFSIINITGLAIGIACCLLILLYINDELSYDRYNKNFDRIYRVLHVYRNAESPGTLPPPSPEEFQVWGSAPVGPALKADFPEIESYFRFTSPVELLFEHGSKRFQEDNMVFADSTAFDIFSWNLISGNAKTALKEPNSIVLTLSTAMKYFGYDEPLGKTITIDQTETFVVTGIMEDVPSNSHFTFDGLISMTTFQIWRPEIFDAWGYVDFYTYFLLKENTHIESLESRIPDFIEHNGPEWYKADNTIALEPLSDAYLHSKAARQPGTTGSYTNIYIFSFIAAFILFIACINFMNLSTARSMERAKEIGVRKTVGAQRHSLIGQFLLESILLTILAATLAIALIALVLPFTRELSGKALLFSDLLSWQFTLLFAVSILLIGLLSGSYPAWILVKFKSSQVLKGNYKTSSGGTSLRKVLVVFQFTLSMSLIVGTAVIYTQLNHLRTQDLGFSDDQMLVIDFGWDGAVQRQAESIKAELKAHPKVSKVSASRAVPGAFFPNAGTTIESADGEMIMHNPGIYEIDQDFIPTYEIEMAAGRAFSKDFPSDTTQALIINEAAARLYGYTKMDDVIGKKFTQWGREGTIVGVVKDFNYKSLHTKVEPLSIRYAPSNSLRHLSLKVSADEMNTTISDIEQQWAHLVPQRPFIYSFLDDSFNKQYEADVRFGKIFTAFSGLAILIACLGLFGLTTYAAALKTKEIGIRKILGASLFSIVTLLSKDYIKLFIIAVLIGIPISWFVMNRWLDGFAYKMQMGPGVFFVAAFICIFIALSTISWQSIQSALRNPVDSLKDE